MNLKDILELILEGITAFAIVFASNQIRLQKKQLNIEVIDRCINEFREKFFGKLCRFTENTDLITGYLDLVNEELFYMQRGYLPKDVSIEWLDGIIDYIPIRDSKSGKVLNSNCCICLLKRDECKLLDPFPRTRHTFSIPDISKEDFSKIYDDDIYVRMKQRKMLIEVILKNLKKFKDYDSSRIARVSNFFKY